MNYFIHYFLIFIVLIFIPAFPTKAVCPVCTITTTVGMGLCRWLGIDDLISGVWLGGMTLSLALWCLSWLSKKQIKSKWAGFLSSVFIYLLVILPLYFSGIIGHKYNKLWGIDKLVLGIALGSLFFAFAVLLEKKLKKINQGKVFFAYQKVIIPILGLIIASVIAYFLTKC